MSSFICQQCFKFIVVHPSFHKINFEELSHGKLLSVLLLSAEIVEHPNVYDVLKPSAANSTPQEEKFTGTLLLALRIVL
jgi:hypothetical protein